MAEQLDHEPTVGTAHCDASAVRRIAAMLDFDPQRCVEGTPLPCGWHFFLLGGETRRSALRTDGFPGFGVVMPDIGLPRLLLVGRSVAYREALLIGDRVERLSHVQSIAHKQGAAGPMAVVTIEHQLRRADAGTPAILETQTYILLGASATSSKPQQQAKPIESAHRKTVQPDETMLFQYSALGFNSHKIHIDRGWARDVEGLPDLVVNGGLVSLLLTEFLRTDLAIVPLRVKARHTAPLYCNRSITLTADRADAGWRARAFDDAGTLAVDMEVAVQ